MPVDPAIPPSADPQQRQAQKLANLESRLSALERVLQGGVLGQIAVVSALPAGQRQGRLVMLAADGVIYKDTGTVWVAVG